MITHSLKEIRSGRETGLIDTGPLSISLNVESALNDEQSRNN